MEIDIRIGLEVHVELLTKTKIFCSCPNAFGKIPNSNTCPVCLGYPGTLPRINKKVLESAIQTSLVLGCRINKKTIFDRKNYFYPDLPKSYQISQLYTPIGVDGNVRVKGEKKFFDVGIRELHMEEDAGKLIHQGEKTFIDYNRAGVPLLEIVTMPDLKNADDTVEFLKELRLILVYSGVSDCKIEEGSMRVDVNISVNRKGEFVYGRRAEIKNLSSFKAVRRAILFEVERQKNIMLSGEEFSAQTRRFDENTGATVWMRDKETIGAYRYFPEPDILPILIDEQMINSAKANMADSLMDVSKRFQKYNLSETMKEQLLRRPFIAMLFEKTYAITLNEKETYNWIMTDFVRIENELNKSYNKLDLFISDGLGQIINMVNESRINRSTGKELLFLFLRDNIDILKYVAEHKLLIVSDDKVIMETVDLVLEEFSCAVSEYKQGKEKNFNFLLGQVMKKLSGKANVSVVIEVLKNKLI